VTVTGGCKGGDSHSGDTRQWLSRGNHVHALTQRCTLDMVASTHLSQGVQGRGLIWGDAK
jgi:hypothetical protein